MITVIPIPQWDTKRNAPEPRPRQAPALVVGQWAIHRALPCGRYWMVTHQATGRRTRKYGICCWASARALMAELSKLDLGFTKMPETYWPTEAAIPEQYRAAWREAGRICRQWPSDCGQCSHKGAI